MLYFKMAENNIIPQIKANSIESILKGVFPNDFVLDTFGSTVVDFQGDKKEVETYRCLVYRNIELERPKFYFFGPLIKVIYRTEEVVCDITRYLDPQNRGLKVKYNRLTENEALYLSKSLEEYLRINKLPVNFELQNPNPIL